MPPARRGAQGAPRGALTVLNAGACRFITPGPPAPAGLPGGLCGIFTRPAYSGADDAGTTSRREARTTAIATTLLERAPAAPRDDPPATGATGRRSARLPLSERQREYLRLVMHGYTDRQIAAGCGVSHSTVRRALADAYRRLGLLAAGNPRTAAAVRLFREECRPHPARQVIQY